MTDIYIGIESAKGKLVERQGRKAKGLRLRTSYDRLVTGIRMYLSLHVTVDHPC